MQQDLTIEEIKTKIHIIIGPNGMCMCGQDEEGKPRSCREIINSAFNRLEDEMNEDEMNIGHKRQLVRDYIKTQKVTMVDLGFDEDVTIEKATEEVLDSILDDLFENLENKLEETEVITTEQAKQVLPAWLEFLKATSDAKLTEHSFVSKIMALWTKYFAGVLDAAFYQEQIRIMSPKGCKTTIKRCEWASIVIDKAVTEKFIPTCNTGRGMPIVNSDHFKYCPFCGKQISWTTCSVAGETEEQLPKCNK